MAFRNNYDVIQKLIMNLPTMAQISFKIEKSTENNQKHTVLLGTSSLLVLPDVGFSFPDYY
jgi:hypothetical protein